MSKHMLFWAMVLVGLALLGMGCWSFLNGNDQGVLPMAAGALLMAAGVLARVRNEKDESGQ